jgi:DNA-binding SARP family transcriptional activator
MLLRIHLFGTVRVERGDWATAPRLTPILQHLLAYLVMNPGRQHAREVLAGIFWGEHPDERSRACLNTALWRLRTALEPVGTRGTYLVSAPTGGVSFDDASDHWVDVSVLEREVGAALRSSPASMDPADAARLGEALALYTGDLLEGSFHDWVLRERERFKALYLDGLQHMMRYHRERGAREQSVAYAELLLARDATREDVQRELMTLFADTGERVRAVRQYGALRSALSRELGMEPSAETRLLYDALVSGDEEAERLLADPQPDVFRELQEALEHLQLARLDVERAIRRLAHEATATSAGSARSVA